jgi:hypothetical protein
MTRATCEKRHEDNGVKAVIIEKNEKDARYHQR